MSAWSVKFIVYITIIGMTCIQRSQGSNVYDLWQASHEDFECSPIADDGLGPVVCFYPDSRQNAIHGHWDPQTAQLISRLLEEGGPELGLIDVGSGLGAYNLLAADGDHQVLAVEENIDSVRRFHKAVRLGRYESRITMLHNAIGDGTGAWVNVQTEDGPHSVPTILLDDLPAFCKFRRALLRMDIDGDEDVVMPFAAHLLREILIPYIFMQWEDVTSKGYDNANHVHEMVTLLSRKGYVPRTLSGRVLSIQSWAEWPEIIYWHKM